MDDRCPLDWICPLLAVDADAFNHGGTAEFAAISPVAQHHNAIETDASEASPPNFLLVDLSDFASRSSFTSVRVERCVGIPNLRARVLYFFGAWYDRYTGFFDPCGIAEVRPERFDSPATEAQRHEFLPIVCFDAERVSPDPHSSACAAINPWPDACQFGLEGTRRRERRSGLLKEVGWPVETARPVR
jgi:hypothetical protein